MRVRAEVVNLRAWGESVAYRKLSQLKIVGRDSVEPGANCRAFTRNAIFSVRRLRQPPYKQ